MIRKDMQCFHVSLLWGGGGCGGPSPEKKLKTKSAGEGISGHFFKALKVSNLPELCLFAAVSEEKVPIYFFLINVFEHKIEMIMPWQICREVLNAYVDPAYQIATAFLRTSFEI